MGGKSGRGRSARANSARCSSRSTDCCASEIGTSCLVFALDASAEGLALRLLDVLVLGIPMPRMLHPRVRTFESERDGRYRFEARRTCRLVGLLVRYAGWLERADVPASA